LGKFNVTLDRFCSQTVGMMVNSMRGNPDISAIGTACGEIPASGPLGTVHIGHAAREPEAAANKASVSKTAKYRLLFILLSFFL